MRLLLLSLAALVATGCGSPWQSSFLPNPGLEEKHFAATESVQIRTVEFERLNRYSQNEHKMRVESPIAPQDLPPEEQLAAKNRLLEALQLRERGDEIDILGWSEFTSEEKLDPSAPELSKFAKSIGADYVVVSSFYAGKAVRTVDRPYTSYSYVTTNGFRRRAGVITQSSTAWVPVNVVEDQFFYSAAFLRKSRP